MQLSDTQRVILSRASQHPQMLLTPPPSLPPAPRAAIAKRFLAAGLAGTIEPQRPVVQSEAWSVDGDKVFLQITHGGLAAIGVDLEAERPPAQTPAQAAEPQPAPNATAEPEGAQAPASAPARLGLRAAAEAFLAAWDASPSQDATDNPISRAVEGIRQAMAGGRTARATGAPRAPRQGTKQEAVLALLRRDKGATGPEMQEATGWAPHTVRGFLAGIQKKGHRVEVIDRQRGKDGAASFTRYRLVQQ